MTLKEIKKEMLNYTDFYGGDILDTDLISSAKSKSSLEAIIESHRSHMEDTLTDAQSHLDRFKKMLGLDMV